MLMLATVVQDQQAANIGIGHLSHFTPPVPDMRDGEFGAIVVDADTDPVRARGQIINPIGGRPCRAHGQRSHEPDLSRLSLGLPLLATILEVADQLFLLGVHRNRRIACRLIFRNGASDVAELDIPILVLPTLPGLLR